MIETHIAAISRSGRCTKTGMVAVSVACCPLFVWHFKFEEVLLETMNSSDIV